MKRRVGKKLLGQALLPFGGRGGKREGAGRKKGERGGLTHEVREDLPKGCPLHVTVRIVEGKPSLRQREEYLVLRRAFRAGKERFGFRLLQYSVMGKHMHFIVEAKDKKALSRGMQGLLIRIARGLNRLWGSGGTVFADRYHAHLLKTPREVRHALAYVLNNARKHGVRLPKRLDVFASGGWFDGWRETFTIYGKGLDDRPTSKARTWLLCKGWRRHRLISTYETPGGPFDP